MLKGLERGNEIDRVVRNFVERLWQPTFLERQLWIDRRKTRLGVFYGVVATIDTQNRACIGAVEKGVGPVAQTTGSIEDAIAVTYITACQHVANDMRVGSAPWLPGHVHMQITFFFQCFQRIKTRCFSGQLLQMDCDIALFVLKRLVV